MSQIDFTFADVPDFTLGYRQETVSHGGFDPAFNQIRIVSNLTNKAEWYNAGPNGGEIGMQLLHLDPGDVQRGIVSILGRGVLDQWKTIDGGTPHLVVADGNTRIGAVDPSGALGTVDRDELTFSCKILVTEPVTSPQSIVHFEDSRTPGTPERFSAELDVGNQFKIKFYDSTGTQFAVAGAPHPMDVLTHIHATYTKVGPLYEIEIYIDGFLAGVSSNPHFPVGLSEMTDLGVCGKATTGNRLKAAVSDICLWPFSSSPGATASSPPFGFLHLLFWIDDETQYNAHNNLFFASPNALDFTSASVGDGTFYDYGVGLEDVYLGENDPLFIAMKNELTLYNELTLRVNSFENLPGYTRGYGWVPGGGVSVLLNTV